MYPDPIPRKRKAGKGKKGKKQKDPNAPKRPLSAYLLFMSDFRAEYMVRMFAFVLLACPRPTHRPHCSSPPRARSLLTPNPLTCDDTRRHNSKNSRRRRRCPRLRRPARRNGASSVRVTRSRTRTPRQSRRSAHHISRLVLVAALPCFFCGRSSQSESLPTLAVLLSVQI